MKYFIMVYFPSNIDTACRQVRASFNPLSPHDALKHHFTSLKTHLFSYN